MVMANFVPLAEISAVAAIATGLIRGGVHLVKGKPKDPRIHHPNRGLQMLKGVAIAAAVCWSVPKLASWVGGPFDAAAPVTNVIGKAITPPLQAVFGNNSGSSDTSNGNNYPQWAPVIPPFGSNNSAPSAALGS
jgi:hypothetical protein